MIYFDSAATSYHRPESVVHAVERALRQLGNPGRGAHEASLEASRVIYGTREKLSDLFECEDPMQVAFTSNATEALNIGIFGLFEAGDHVITTAMEHNSVLRPLYIMENNGVELTILPADKSGNISYTDMEKAIRENTKAIIVTHASNVTGNITDLEEVGRMAKTHGVLLFVDASQTAGHIPVSVKKFKIDVLCFTGHKGLMGPQGTGGIYVDKHLRIKPFKVGGSGIGSLDKAHPDRMPEALEAGTLNSHGIAGLHAALEYLEKSGINNIAAKEKELMQRFFNGVENIPGVKIYGDFTTNQRASIVSLNIRDYYSSQVSDELFTRFGIATRSGIHCAPLMHREFGTVNQGMVRFSFSWYNTYEEIDKGIEAIQLLAIER